MEGWQRRREGVGAAQKRTDITVDGEKYIYRISPYVNGIDEGKRTWHGEDRLLLTRPALPTLTPPGKPGGLQYLRSHIDNRLRRLKHGDIEPKLGHAFALQKEAVDGWR